ncbi:hypothetical protein EOA13_09405 [Mesorhizobium sp. M7A.F.Ca.US.011.01.1.1]|nr:hypothetical protein EOA19_14260 [Mesorhizobium sp. M7A.F.Ca.US.010.02.1.1]RUX30597.1 hypothetical protein EOA13_09405 [Mesorhizobium sp. M7A.F.Ca.US.011.01.1.1]
MRSRTPPSVLPDISPARGEIVLSSRLSPIVDGAQTKKVAKGAPSAKLPISPLAGEMPGRAEGGVTERKFRQAA